MKAQTCITIEKPVYSNIDNPSTPLLIFFTSNPSNKRDPGRPQKVPNHFTLILQKESYAISKFGCLYHLHGVSRSPERYESSINVKDAVSWLNRRSAPRRRCHRLPGVTIAAVGLRAIGNYGPLHCGCGAAQTVTIAITFTFCTKVGVFAD